jgi:hypothetical protein
MLLALFTAHDLAAPRPGGRYLSYSVDDLTLMRYEGLSDLRNAAGDNFQTAITLRSGDVKPADDRLNSSARQASLAACK